MSAFVIDTNVIAVANGFADHVDKGCVENCNDFLMDTYGNKSIIVIDNFNLIFEEYFRYANRSGKPNFGDTFVKWIFENQYNNTICEIVKVTPINDEKTNFDEIPVGVGLDNFDPSDKKFIAVAIGSEKSPEICNRKFSG